MIWRLLPLITKGVVPLAHVFLHAPVRVELFPHLVEINNLQAGALPDRALVRRQFSQQQAQQGGLARSVGADDPHPVSAHDGGGQVGDDRAAVVGKGDSSTSATSRPERSASCNWILAVPWRSRRRRYSSRRFFRARTRPSFLSGGP